MVPVEDFVQIKSHSESVLFKSSGIAFLRFVHPMPEDAVFVEIQCIVVAPPGSCHCPGVIAALHKFPNVIGPNGFSSFIDRHLGWLTEVLLDLFLCGAVCRR